MVFSCFACCSTPLVPEDHTELSREELKRLYDRSITLNGGKLFVHGIFARANTRNNNKRVYPKHILEREVSRFEVEHVLPGTALGELDHPNYASKYFKCLNLPNISHQVLEVQWKGDQLWGTIEVLPTPSGLLLWELYSRGVKLGVSSRGWASLRSDPASKCVFVDDDFELITFDFVTEPSTRGAYLAPVQRRYKRPVPDQSRLVATAHLGHGVVAMEKVARVPGPGQLVARVAELQRASAAAIAQLSAAPAGAGPGVLSASCGPGPGPCAGAPGFKPSGLDNLLCYGHYVVHQSAPYLDREQHARDYRAHLVIFTARAHLADERLAGGTMSRSDIDALILSRVVTKESFDPAAASFAARLDAPASFPPPGIHLTASTAAGALGTAAAAAETQGPPGPDASLMHPQPPPHPQIAAAAAGALHGVQQPGVQGVHGVGGRAQGGGGPGPRHGPGDLDSWALHPHALNSISPCASGSLAAAAPPGSLPLHGGAAAHHACGTGTSPGTGLIRSHCGEPGGAGGGAGGGGGLRILPVVVPSQPAKGPARGGAGADAGAAGTAGGGSESGGSRGPGAGPGSVPSQEGLGPASGGEEDPAALRAWLSSLPGGPALAQGFLDIRASLLAFAHLYQAHQRRVEAGLMKQLGAGAGCRL